jgi:hypothetical protein
LKPSFKPRLIIENDWVSEKVITFGFRNRNK